jgi:hypothetical protein
MPNPVYNPNGTPTPGTVTTAIQNACESTGVPVSVLTGICQNESSYGQNAKLPAVGPAGEVGIMQMTPGALDTVNSQFGTTYTPADMNDPNIAALASAQYVSYLTNYYQGKTSDPTSAAVAAYNAGQGNVDNVIATYGVVTPATMAAYSTSTGHATGTSSYLQNVDNTVGSSGNLAPGQATPQNNAAAISGNPINGDPMPSPIPFSPLPQLDISDEQLATISPVLVPDQAGLSSLPWYSDTNLLTGNPRLHKMGFPQGFPLVFEVYMDQTNPNSLLTTASGSGSTSVVGTLAPPVMIPLNCSVTNFKLSSKHIVNKQPTRTGFHVTLWGMTADVIEGSGSTGLFMNQYGVTDFLSLAGTNSDAVQAVLAAYTNTQSGVDLEQVYLPTGNPAQPATPLTQEAANYNAEQIATGSTYVPQNYVEPFRIAAEDAFQEFLALFKMNGVTWLHPSGYSFDSDNNNAQNTSNNANQTQALAVYATGVGASDFAIKARNNDVYKRGFVLMKFRNSQYLGFFKSLSWAMDAEKPYQWRFSFVFQVERTLSLVYYPTPAATPVGGVTG